MRLGRAYAPLEGMSHVEAGIRAVPSSALDLGIVGGVFPGDRAVYRLSMYML